MAERPPASSLPRASCRPHVTAASGSACTRRARPPAPTRFHWAFLRRQGPGPRYGASHLSALPLLCILPGTIFLLKSPQFCSLQTQLGGLQEAPQPAGRRLHTFHCRALSRRLNCYIAGYFFLAVWPYFVRVPRGPTAGGWYLGRAALRVLCRVQCPRLTPLPPASSRSTALASNRLSLPSCSLKPPSTL